MLENIKKLEEWYKNTKGFKNLSIKEAKELTKKMLNTTDKSEKKTIQEELFLGTTYIFYKMLKHSYFMYQPVRTIDIDDIISAACELWFSYCIEGKFLEIKNYSNLYIRFFSKLNTALFKTDFPFSSWKITKKDLIKFCIRYILYRRNFDDFSYSQFQEIFLENTSYEIYYCYEAIYNEISKTNLLENELEVAVNKLNVFLPNLLYQYINALYNSKDNTSFICRQASDDEYSEIENNLLRKQVRTIFNETKKLNERKKEILAKRVGFYDDKEKILPEIGEEYNISGERVRILIYEATRYFRNVEYKDGVNLRKIYEDYDFTR